MDNNRSYAAFAGQRLVAAGALAEVTLRARQHLDLGDDSPLLVFDDTTGQQVDLDLRDSPASDEVARVQAADQANNQGRPRPVVEEHEVALLPRHWAWLQQQPGGAAAALRRLVEQARKHNVAAQRARAALEAAGQFMWTMTGDLPNFEEATRALFARDQQRLERLIADWPSDLRKHVEKLSREALRLEREASCV